MASFAQMKDQHPDRTQRWHGKRRDGTWYLIGTVTTAQAKVEAEKEKLLEIATDQGLCTLV